MFKSYNKQINKNLSPLFNHFYVIIVIVNCCVTMTLTLLGYDKWLYWAFKTKKSGNWPLPHMQNFCSRLHWIHLDTNNEIIQYMKVRLSNRVENIVAKWEITCDEQFLYFAKRLSKIAAEASVIVCMWKMVLKLNVAISNNVQKREDFICWMEQLFGPYKLCQGSLCSVQIMVPLTLSHIQQICSRWLWKHFGKNTENAHKCRYNYWKELKTLWQKKKLLLFQVDCTREVIYLW